MASAPSVHGSAHERVIIGAIAAISTKFLASVDVGLTERHAAEHTVRHRAYFL
jgi:hypothetical protein